MRRFLRQISLGLLFLGWHGSRWLLDRLLEMLGGHLTVMAVCDLLGVSQPACRYSGGELVSQFGGPGSPEVLPEAWPGCEAGFDYRTFQPCTHCFSRPT